MMYKPLVRAVPRHLSLSRSVNVSKRFLNTAPPTQKSRSWKSSAVRWGLAAAGVYYYNTSIVFAEEPEAAIQRLDESIHSIQESNQPTIGAIVAEKRERHARASAEEKRKERAAETALAADEQIDDAQGGDDGLDELEEEAGQQGAFNPETGEINWDCPCLGGMAHGPCGEEFKAAFSCFVYSNEEPKGVECIDKFKGMQDCFRQHPEMYASELEDDEDEVEEELRAREAAPSDESVTDASTDSSDLSKTSTVPARPEPKRLDAEHPGETPNTAVGSAQTSANEADEQLPRSAHDATSN